MSGIDSSHSRRLFSSSIPPPSPTPGRIPRSPNTPFDNKHQKHPSTTTTTTYYLDPVQIVQESPPYNNNNNNTHQRSQSYNSPLALQPIVPSQHQSNNTYNSLSVPATPQSFLRPHTGFYQNQQPHLPPSPDINDSQNYGSSLSPNNNNNNNNNNFDNPTVTIHPSYSRRNDSNKVLTKADPGFPQIFVGFENEDAKKISSPTSTYMISPPSSTFMEDSNYRNSMRLRDVSEGYESALSDFIDHISDCASNGYPSPSPLAGTIDPKSPHCLGAVNEIGDGMDLATLSAVALSPDSDHLLLPGRQGSNTHLTPAQRRVSWSPGDSNADANRCEEWAHAVGVETQAPSNPVSNRIFQPFSPLDTSAPSNATHNVPSIAFTSAQGPSPNHHGSLSPNPNPSYSQCAVDEYNRAMTQTQNYPTPFPPANHLFPQYPHPYTPHHRYSPQHQYTPQHQFTPHQGYAHHYTAQHQYTTQHRYAPQEMVHSTYNGPQENTRRVVRTAPRSPRASPNFYPTSFAPGGYHPTEVCLESHPKGINLTVPDFSNGLPPPTTDSSCAERNSFNLGIESQSCSTSSVAAVKNDRRPAKPLAYVEHLHNVQMGPHSSSETKPTAPFICQHPGCGKSFTRPYNLKSHARTHASDRPFACETCGQTFSRQHDMKRHARLHLGVKPYSCSGCQRSFARLDALNRHLKASPDGTQTRCSASTSASVKTRAKSV